MPITIKDMGEIYGSLNEIEPNVGPSGDRRITSTTDALSRALSDLYTPDALENRNTFLGIVLISYPTRLPRQGSKQELIHSPTATETESGAVGNTLYPYYDVYKVYIPELEPIPLNWDEPAPPKDSRKMSLQQRVMTFDDIIPSNEILQDMPGPITPGTLVAVQYEDMSSLKNPRIVGVSPGGPAFLINLRKGISGLKHAWKRGGVKTGISGFSWSGGKKQKRTAWKAPADDPSATFNGQVLLNGELHLIKDFFKQNEDGSCALVQPAFDDWTRMAADYKAKFPKRDLRGGGARTYKGQEAVRMKRVAGDNACSHVPQCLVKAGQEGAGVCDKNCNQIGYAAVPGTSPHGWGAAVDCKSSSWRGGSTFFPCRGKSAACLPGACTDEGWIWLNRYAMNYNFAFNVKGEHWHLGWLPFGQFTSIAVTQTRWDPTGIDEHSAFYTHPEVGADTDFGPGAPTTTTATAPTGPTGHVESDADRAEREAREQERVDAETQRIETERLAGIVEEEAKELQILVNNCDESALSQTTGQTVQDCEGYRMYKCQNFFANDGWDLMSFTERKSTMDDGTDCAGFNPAPLLRDVGAG